MSLYLFNAISLNNKGVAIMSIANPCNSIIGISVISTNLLHLVEMQSSVARRTPHNLLFASRRDATSKGMDASLRDAKTGWRRNHLATERCISPRCEKRGSGVFVLLQSFASLSGCRSATYGRKYTGG